jgi:hypothetical protein
MPVSKCIFLWAVIAVVAMSAAMGDDGVLLFPNSDFEQGDLTNWRQEGDAFKYQPTLGDNALVRDPTLGAHPQGNFYVGTYDRYQGKQGQKPGASQTNAPRGGLLSTPFLIEKPYISFLVGGGDTKDVGVRLVVEAEIVYEVSGQRTPTMRRVWWDVSEYKGGKARIYIVDGSSEPWGIVNADDFRAHDHAPVVTLFENSDFSAGGLVGWTASGALSAVVTQEGAAGAFFSGAKEYTAIRVDQAAEDPQGVLTSAEFTIDAEAIEFAIAGIGGQVELVVEGESVHQAMLGSESGGLRTFTGFHWNVTEIQGKTAQIRITADGRDQMVNFGVSGFTRGRAS